MILLDLYSTVDLSLSSSSSLSISMAPPLPPFVPFVINAIQDYVPAYASGRSPKTHAQTLAHPNIYICMCIRMYIKCKCRWRCDTRKHTRNMTTHCARASIFLFYVDGKGRAEMTEWKQIKSANICLIQRGYLHS